MHVLVWTVHWVTLKCVCVCFCAGIDSVLSHSQLCVCVCAGIGFALNHSEPSVCVCICVHVWTVH